MGIDALVLAGDRKGAKLLYGTNKAFLYLRGKPLLTYVLSALESSKQVDKIHIVGPEERLRELLAEFQFSKPITYICLLYTSPSPRDRQKSRMPSSA